MRPPRTWTKLKAANPSLRVPPNSAPLGLTEVAELAVQQQPLLTGLDAQARAAREGAFSSAQLPDPQLFGGVRDLPIQSHEAYSLSDDSDTQLVIGVSQEIPRAAKRRLRAEQREREADRLHDERRLTALSVRRDASLAWLDCWRAESARQIAVDTLDAAQLQAQAVAIDVRSGSATQSDYVSALLNVERMRDAVAERDQASDAARFRLERWVGDAAHRPVSRSHPNFRRCRQRRHCWNDFHRIRNSPCFASASTSRGPASISPKRNGRPTGASSSATAIAATIPTW